MRKWRWIFITISVIFSLLYAFAYFVVIPKAAVALLPLKWGNIPAGLNKNKYEAYFGQPVKAASQAAINKDRWVVRNGNYTYFLNIGYNAENIADTVELDYTFSNYLFHKEGNLLRDKEE